MEKPQYFETYLRYYCSDKNYANSHSKESPKSAIPRSLWRWQPKKALATHQDARRGNVDEKMELLILFQWVTIQATQQDLKE